MVAADNTTAVPSTSSPTSTSGYPLDDNKPPADPHTMYSECYKHRRGSEAFAEHAVLSRYTYDNNAGLLSTTTTTDADSSSAASSEDHARDRCVEAATIGNTLLPLTDVAQQQHRRKASHRHSISSVSSTEECPNSSYTKEQILDHPTEALRVNNHNETSFMQSDSVQRSRTIGPAVAAARSASNSHHHHRHFHHSSSEMAAAVRKSIRENSHDEPMSSEKALHIFNTMFPVVASISPLKEPTQLAPRHDGVVRSQCKQCAADAIFAAHHTTTTTTTATKNAPNSELRMNLGEGRNAVYVAPCERHLECPVGKMGKYLIHTNNPKIMTDMSKVEFGIRVDGWERVVFKTVNDPMSAQRELSFYHKISKSNPPSNHVMHLLDEFTDSDNKQVIMVFPRANSAEIHGHNLYGIAYLARQLFVALDDLHKLGIAHLDITPTNIMSDAHDRTHIKLIDFGLACDISDPESGGQLPSRGTCGFVAPEILSGGARDLRADIYSAGVVLGMMLKRYLPTINLRLLGGPLIRSDTTDMVISQIDELLSAYRYTPESADFVECDTRYVSPAFSSSDAPSFSAVNYPSEAKPSSISSTNTAASSVASSSTPVKKPLAQAMSFSDAYHRDSRCSYYSDEDDEADAFMAAYVGGRSAALYGNLGNVSDNEDEGEGLAADSGDNEVSLSGTTFYSRNNFSSTPHSNADNGGSSNFTYPPTSYKSEYYAKKQYVSPANSPVYPHDLYDRPRSTGMPTLFDNASEYHSSARYMAGNAHRHHHSKNLLNRLHQQTVNIHTTRSAQDFSSANDDKHNNDDNRSSVKKPGNVPVSVLHAADLLRWTLQANPQCRPTAVQVLSHPFLSSIVIRQAAIRNIPSRHESPVDVVCFASASPQSPPMLGNSSHYLHQIKGDNSIRPSSEAAQSNQELLEMFQNTSLDDIHNWEEEMYLRVSHGAGASAASAASAAPLSSAYVGGGGGGGVNAFHTPQGPYGHNDVHDEMASFYNHGHHAFDDEEEDLSSYFF